MLHNWSHYLYISKFLQPIEKISSKGYSGFYMECSTCVFSYFRAFVINLFVWPDWIWKKAKTGK